MDLAYLRAHPQHLSTFLAHQRIRETPVGGGDVCAATRLTLDDGTSVFAKSWPSGSPPEHFFRTEAAGLKWLAEASAAPVPEVISVTDDLLALEWIEPGSPSAAAADRFGRELAEVHRAGAEGFGAPWPGFIGPLRQDNTASEGPWGAWFAERRLLPYLRMSADRGALDAGDVELVEQVLSRIDTFGGAEAPARLHGDLWPGNVLWGADGRAWLIDPAAHGGHRETDLAQLALFGGAPHLDRIVAAYQEVWPLSDGWQGRVPLHQLQLLLVHTAAFGTGYRGSVVAAASAALRG
ncbi:fructosamine kinase family protein [Symbioplanes lichenis]|uniref:fructosamine kinase family protein n=1 Tax=Symbioplanes lichenis TaxID=1629072 RepID=UPI0027384979|nr:fructosamine kinase family protein [Actinoplanes lichenis]